MHKLPHSPFSQLPQSLTRRLHGLLLCVGFVRSRSSILFLSARLYVQDFDCGSVMAV